MTPDEMFFQYRLLNPMICDYSHAIFSLSGIRENVLDEKIKEIIVPAFVFLESGEEMPLVGDYQVLTAEDGSALAILKIKKTEVAPFSLFENDSTTVVGNASDDDIVIKMYFYLKEKV